MHVHVHVLGRLSDWVALEHKAIKHSYRTQGQRTQGYATQGHATHTATYLVELEQVALHNDQLQGEALLRLIGKADLQPYAVAATVVSRGCNRSWQRLQTYVLLLFGKGGGADRRRRELTMPCTYYAVNLLCRGLTMPCTYYADRRCRRRLHRRLQRQQCLQLGALHL